jgi:hypothetical protein
LSPIASVLDAANCFEPMNVPPVDASHKETCVIVSAAATDDHKRSASVVIDCDAAAANDVDLRVDADATAVVPAEPGSAVCNCVQTAEYENAVALPIASRIELRAPLESPSAIYLSTLARASNYYAATYGSSTSASRIARNCRTSISAIACASRRGTPCVKLTASFTMIGE